MQWLSRFVAIVATLLLPSTLAAQFTLQARFASNLPPGPHTVGFRVVEQYDGSRVPVDPAEYGSNPDRYVRGRPMHTFIWYPAQTRSGASPMRFREYAELFAPDGNFPAHDQAGRGAALAGLLQYLQQHDSSSNLIQSELALSVQAFRDAVPVQGRFPVVVYAPGSNAPAIQNERLCEYLASQGYIVIASPSWGRLGELETTARDLEFLTAFARTMPNADARRIALMGHSLGGVAVVLVASRNPSISAVVSLDGTMVYQHKYLSDAVPARALREYAVPSLFLTQAPFTPEMRETFNAESTFVFFDGLRYADAWRVSFNRLRHRNFNSLTNRLAAPGDPLEFNPDLFGVSSDWDAMATYALNFLNAYLRSDAKGLAFLSESPTSHGFSSNVASMEHKAGWPDRYGLVRRLQAVDAGQIATERDRIIARVGTYSDLDARSLNDWAKVLIGSRPSDAVASTRVMTKLYPTFAGGFVTAGVAELAAAGDTVTAARHFRRALELDSSLTWLKGWIAQYEQRSSR